ncbi:putative S-adenosyl-L-methionine-dependent methyltransferase [Chlorella vulgaris]
MEMAQTEAKRLRLFTTLGSGPPAAPSSAVGPAPETARRLEVVASSSNKWSPFYSFSTRHDMPTTSLLLHCIARGHSSAAQLTGFDAEGGMDGRDGQLAAAFAEHLVGGWRHLSYTPGWRWHLQNVLESPCFGVPGLCTYNAARAAWIRQQVQAAVEGDSCRQVVVLRAGWSTWSHSLAQPGVQFYEVDSRQAVQRKKEALDALLPGWRRAARRPRFVEVDFSGSVKALITELTGAGFDPSLRCTVVAEGLLAYLSQDQADNLVRDLSALCAPGSRFLFDCLHAEALESPAGDLLPGFAALAAAAANKGQPLRLGLKPAFSAMVKYFQPAVMQPRDLAAFWKQHQQAASTHKAAGQAAAASPAAKATLPPPPSPEVFGALPYVPEYISLVAVTKIDSRLMLRRAATGSSPTSGEEAAALGGGMSGWLAAGTAAALTSPSCVVRSLAFLLWGGARLQAQPTSSSPPTAPVRVPALLPPPPLHHQRSTEWSLAAGVSQPAATSDASGDDSRRQQPMAAETTSSAAVAAAAVPGAPPEANPSSSRLQELVLHHALSIGPVQEQRVVPGSAVRGHDSGHLLGAATSTDGSAQRPASANDETAWSESSMFSFSLFF